MKKLSLLATSLLITCLVMAQPAAPKDITKMAEFKNADYNMGKITYGKALEYDVEVKNISNEVITLEKVEVGCGCTVPKYEAGRKINPGETYKITLGFNGGTMGAFTKFATLFFNDGMSRQVKFSGEAVQQQKR